MKVPSRRDDPRRADGGAAVIAVVNIGSSSLKFALFDAGSRTRPIPRLASGKIDRVGLSGGTLAIFNGSGSPVTRRRAGTQDQAAAVRQFLAWVDASPYRERLAAVGHRIVHGGRSLVEPQRVTPRMLRGLRTLAPLDPDHLPAEIEGIRLVARRHPDLPQVACFDTAFHRTMPPVAQRYALPRRWEEEGVLRYGFHGLSCEHVVASLAAGRERGGFPARLVVAHLGNGCSLTAIRDGRSVDTTMGFTPTGGLVMGTRPGDLDPEVVLYLAERSGQTPVQLGRFLNHSAGLLGVSGTTGDMRDLVRRAPKERRAREAVDLFCYQAQKFLGAMTSVLGGLDMLVFTGGIGENSPEVRRRISAGVEHLGLRIDARRNDRNRPVISTQNSRVAVRIVPADEEQVIATHTVRLLHGRRPAT
jgi:acetate kinase